MREFDVEPVDYTAAAAGLHAVREAVFVREQGVPAELEQDPADPHCLHVLARDSAGHPIGAARLVPPFVSAGGCVGEHTDPATVPMSADRLPRIGRMAVLAEWRGRGVGEAMLDALTALARERGWPELALHAQASAVGFYARLGYLPHGVRFTEAGIEHQAMHRRLHGVSAIDTRDQAVAVTTALTHRTRRRLSIYSRALDPGLFDAPEVLEALRSLGVRGGGIEIRILFRWRSGCPACSCCAKWTIRSIAPIRPPSSPTMPAATTSADWATASTAKPIWTRPAAAASCARSSTASGSVRGLAASCARSGSSLRSQSEKASATDQI
jgi:predicted GNAT family N-acyltransferase